MTSTSTRAGSPSTAGGSTTGRDDRWRTPTRRASRWVPWLMGLLATVVSASGSWIPSLWGDEATSVLSATRPLPSLWRMLGHVDAVHGTYYFGLHWWVRVFGTSPFSVRLPPAIAVGFAVVAVVLLVRRLSDEQTALIAGFVCVLLPRVTYMGEETRSYAFSAAIAAWLLVLLVDLVSGRRTGRRWWVLFGVLLCYGMYTFLYFGLFVAVHAIVLLAARVPRSVWRRWAITTAAAIVGASPVAILSYLERAQISFLGSQTTTDPMSLLVALWFTNVLYAVVAWVLIALAAVMWAVRVVRQRRAGSAQRATGSSAPAGEAVPSDAPGGSPAPAVLAHGVLPSLELVGFAWLLVPGALLLLSNLFTPDFTGRYLSMSAPGAAVVIAAAIRALVGRWRVAAALATVAVMVVSVPAYVSQRTPYAKNNSDWAEVSALIGEHAKAGGAVVFDESARPSRRPRLGYHVYPAGYRGLHDVTLKVPYTKSRTWHDDAYTVAQALAKGRFDGYAHVWVVEYDLDGADDRYGLADLEKAGYSIAATYRTHSSKVYELTR